LDFKISNRWQEKWWHLERSSCGMWDLCWSPEFRAGVNGLIYFGLQCFVCRSEQAWN